MRARSVGATVSRKRRGKEYAGIRACALAKTKEKVLLVGQIAKKRIFKFDSNILYIHWVALNVPGVRNSRVGV